MTTSKALLGFIAGAAIGGIAAALTAPQSGAQTRRKLANRAQDFNADARDRLEAGTTQAKTVAEEKASLAKDAVTTVADRLSDVTSTAKDVVQQNVEAVSFAASRGAEAYREKLQDNEGDPNKTHFSLGSH